jgi:hypothetical protein
MNPKLHPEVDEDLVTLRRTLQDQREAKADALRRVKQTAMRAVECYDAPTTYLDPKLLKDRLDKDDESNEDAPSEE